MKPYKYTIKTELGTFTTITADTIEQVVQRLIKVNVRTIYSVKREPAQ